MNFFASSEYIAIYIILAIFLLLIFLFLALIIYSVIRRTLLNKQERDNYDSEQYILPLIYRFMDGEVNLNEFSNLLRSTNDTVVAFRNITEMIDNFRDEEKEKLRSLLGLRHFNKYFLKKLFSNKPVDIAQACSFYEKRITADKRIIDRLFKLQQHQYSVINYAATLALINVKDPSIRNRSLKMFLLKENNATMAIHDIIFKYHAQQKDLSSAEDFLFKLVTDRRLPLKNAAAVIKMFPELGFFSLSGPLFDFFVSGPPYDENGTLQATLLQVLNQFHEPGVSREIIDRNLHKSDFQKVRLETAHWIFEHFNFELIPELLVLAADQDLQVRIVAQSALLNCPDIGQVDYQLNSVYQQEWMSIKQTGGAHVTSF